MSIVRFPQMVIVSPSDRDLELLIQAAGMRAKVVAMAELAAMAHPTARPPQLVIVDLRDTAMVPAQVALLRRNHPETAVVIVCRALDPALMLEAMRAGVTECLSAPLTAEDLEAAIARVSHLSTHEPTGSVFGFIGARGGVGTTTMAVNTAAVLCREAPGETLLIDLHVSRGDASVLLGVDARFSVLDALENTHRLDEAFFKSLIVEPKGRPAVLASSERVMVAAPSADRVRALLDFAGTIYRYVILDLPPDDHNVLDALDGVARVVVVANQELSSVRNAARLLAAFRQRYGRDRLSLVLNRYDRQAEITETDIQKVVGMPPAFMIPNDYRAALRAANEGKPLVLHDEVRLAGSIRLLAKTLAGLQAKPGTQADSAAGLFSRFAARRS